MPSMNVMSFDINTDKTQTFGIQDTLDLILIIRTEI